MKIDFAIGFVVFRPTEGFLTRLKLLDKCGCRVYIYDNSPEECTTRSLVREFPAVTYLTCGKNLGLGVGVSSICAHAYYDSFQTLLFFDQDTIFNESTISYIQKFSEKKLIDIQSSYSAVVFNAKDYSKKNQSDKLNVTNVDLVISSGSLFILENLKKIGWHNECYFVDLVDYEFCLRSLINNLKIGECRNAPGFDHSSEQPDKEYQVMGRAVSLRSYALSRIVDTSKASLKLVATSLLARQPKFALLIVRSYTLYFVAQILARIKST